MHLLKYASCYYMCLRIQHAFKDFLSRQNLFKYYCVYPFERNSTIFTRMPHHFFAICLTLFQKNTASYCIQWRTFFTGETLSKSCSIAFCYKAMWHVLKEIPHHSPQSIPKCQFTGTYILWLNISHLDRNVYVRIQHSKIPRFAQDSLGECWKPDIQKIEKLNPKERSWASSFPEENSFA